MKTKAILLFLFLSISFNFLMLINPKALVKPLTINETQENDSLLSRLVFRNGNEFTIFGKYHNEPNYTRLPSKYKELLRPEVWSLSTNSSGVSIGFKTNSTRIAITWSVKSNSNRPNMTKLSSSGVDLYCLKNGKWQYVNSGIPTDRRSTQVMITDMDSTYKDFLLNLPLYDITEDVEIGIDAEATITPGAAIRKGNRIVFYGTSITQGSSASRPGMTYTSIISRKFNSEVINLGFSGNGRFENSVGQALCEIESEILILDCTPNSPPDTIRKNVPLLLKQLRKCKPATPILLMESIVREYAHFKTSGDRVFGSVSYIQAQNMELEHAFNAAISDGIGNLYYLKADDLIGSDHEATVDGTHLSDLGMTRIATKLHEKITEITSRN